MKLGNTLMAAAATASVLAGGAAQARHEVVVVRYEDRYHDRYDDRPRAVEVRELLTPRFADALNDLRLSSRQRDRIDGYTRDAVNRARDIRNNRRLSYDDRRDRLFRVARDLRDGIAKNILNDEQRDRLNRLEDNRGRDHWYDRDDSRPGR